NTPPPAANAGVTGGPCAVPRHADARVRGYKRVHVEPHLSITGACSAEWVPIRPKTDPAFMFALIHVLLHEHGLAKLDVPFLRDRTASPYLVGPDGLYLRDFVSGKPLVWDEATEQAVAFDTPDTVLAVAGRYRVASAATVDADAARREYSDVDGKTLAFRPVAVTLGKSVNNGWGAFECCWSRTVLAALVGALENPGGTLGTTVRLNRPQDNRHLSVKPGEDGFMVQHFNPTGSNSWRPVPETRNLHTTPVPI